MTRPHETPENAARIALAAVMKLRDRAEADAATIRRLRQQLADAAVTLATAADVLSSCRVYDAAGQTAQPDTERRLVSALRGAAQAALDAAEPPTTRRTR